MANDVTLDVRGHSISVRNEGPAIYVAGGNVTLRNGAVGGSDDQGFPLSIQGSSATIESLRVSGQNASAFGGATASELVVRNSTFFSGLIGLPAGSILERNTFAPRDTARGATVTVDGRSNLIRGNTFQVDGSSEPLLRVNNGANVLESNVALPTPGGERAGVGIQFTADGNAFGNNRLAALLPVDLGGTLQTDLGGNVGF